jgi:hypothetical protein
VLLDEDLPIRLRSHFPQGVHVETVDYRGWKGRKNGELLSAAEGEFDVLVTIDRVARPCASRRTCSPERPLHGNDLSTALNPGSKQRTRRSRGCPRRIRRRRISSEQIRFEFMPDPV